MPVFFVEYMFFLLYLHKYRHSGFPPQKRIIGKQVMGIGYPYQLSAIFS